MKRLLQNKSLVTVLAMAACIVILVFAYRYRVSKALDEVNVLIATKTLDARSPITADDFRTQAIPRSMLSDDVIRNEKDLLEHYVNYNTFIPEGSLFYKSAVVEWKNMPDSAWGDIPECSTIVSLPVNTNTTYGNSIYPGDKIDLFYQSEVNGKIFIGKFIEGIEVLAVKDSNGNHIFNKTNNQSTAAALIFAVSDYFKDENSSETRDLHLLFRKAMYAGGQIIPVPRRSGYNKDTNVSSEYIEKFINSKIDSAPVEIEDQKCKDYASTRVR